MGAIRAPGFLLQQPQIFAGFNPAFPRPSFAYGASLGSYDRAGQKPGAKASGDAVRVTQQATAYKVARATNGGLDFGANRAITSDSFTIVVLANGASTDGVSTLFSQREGSSPFRQIDFCLNAADGLTGLSGAFSLHTFDTVDARAATSTATNLVDGGFHVWGVTRAAAASPVLWRDGAQVAATLVGTGTGTVLSAAQKTRIGNIGDYTGDAAYCSSSDIATVLTFNGVLSDAQMRALTESLLAPYRTFAAPRRIWIPPPAFVASGSSATAAVGVATVSAVGASVAASVATAAAGASTASVSGAAAASSAPIVAGGIATASAIGASIAASTPVPAAGASIVGATSPVIALATCIPAQGTSVCSAIGSGGVPNQTLGGGSHPFGFAQDRPGGPINRYPRRRRAEDEPALRLRPSTTLRASSGTEPELALPALSVAEGSEAEGKELSPKERKRLRKEVERSLLSKDAQVRGIEQLADLLTELQAKAEQESLNQYRDDEETLLLLAIM